MHSIKLKDGAWESETQLIIGVMKYNILITKLLNIEKDKLFKH